MSNDILTLWPQEEDVVPMTSSRSAHSATNGYPARENCAMPARPGRPPRLTAADFASPQSHIGNAFLELAAAIAFGSTGPLNRRS